MLKSNDIKVDTTKNDVVLVPHEAWEVIRLQAKSLEKKDSQVEQLISMLRLELKKKTISQDTAGIV